MPSWQLPQEDRTPQTELLLVDITPTVVTSDPTPFHEVWEAQIILPPPPLSTPGQGLMGDLVLRMFNIIRPYPYNPLQDYFTVTIGAGANEYVVGADGSDDAGYHFSPWTDCEDRELTVRNAYPQSAIADNVHDPGPPYDGEILPIYVRWKGGMHRYDLCGDPSEVQVELQYDHVVQGTDTESRDLQLWGEDLCQNVAFAPCLPPPGHNRMVGFFDDKSVPIPPGRHRLPNNFSELFTMHTARMVEEDGSASAEVCKHSYASMVIAPDGYARGYFCSQPESLDPRGFQQNHYAHPFVQMGDGEADLVPSPKDVPVSEYVPRGMCAFIGTYHAPRWTELLYYSRRETCRGVL